MRGSQGRKATKMRGRRGIQLTPKAEGATRQAGYQKEGLTRQIDDTNSGGVNRKAGDQIRG